MKQVLKTLESNKLLTLSITQAALGILPSDVLIPSVSATHTYDLHPDWSSLKPGPVQGHVSCYGDFRLTDGSNCIYCPRQLLSETVDQAAANDRTFLIGFEIEFVVLEKSPHPRPENESKYRTIPNDGHAWSMSRALSEWGREGSIVTVLDEMVDLLNDADIPIEQLHAEGAPGQFEIVLPPLPPLQACDTLLHARQIIESAAARHGFRATLHPKPFAERPGTAAHAHMSLSSSSRGDESNNFYAGILNHLRALAAFTYTNPASYDRAVDSCWAGGSWVAWGTQNRETPLRKIEGSHWEFKALDGLANPYIAIAALLMAGLDGVASKTSLEQWDDCDKDPASLEPEQRAKLGITQALPKNLNEALDRLMEDTTLKELIGEKFVDRYVDVKRAELTLLKSMNDEERREWLIERY
ncbi:uncharacterized protein PG998_006284 [Apiospora kogelbergensis]|uniref:uncharacterized protein n=1 Tax=Apiospora kogelbergensis TaxID=1337665 RepID=UPI00312D7BD3